MSEQEFIEKWRGKESGMWAESACALYWARCYGMHPLRLTEMSVDYMSVPVEKRAPCSERMASQVIR